MEVYLSASILYTPLIYTECKILPWRSFYFLALKDLLQLKQSIPFLSCSFWLLPNAAPFHTRMQNEDNSKENGMRFYLAF
jgi:hypothetical protein